MSVEPVTPPMILKDSDFRAPWGRAVWARAHPSRQGEAGRATVGPGGTSVLEAHTPWRRFMEAEAMRR